MTHKLLAALLIPLGIACSDTPTDPFCVDRSFVTIYDDQGRTGNKVLSPGQSVNLIGVVLSGERGRTGEGCQRFLYSSSTRPESFAWTSSNQSAVTVTAAGRLTAVGLGASVVRVTDGEQLDEIFVSVESGGQPFVAGR